MMATLAQATHSYSPSAARSTAPRPSSGANPTVVGIMVVPVHDGQVISPRRSMATDPVGTWTDQVRTGDQLENSKALSLTNPTLARAEQGRLRNVAPAAAPH